jgi:choline dehydrogenase
MDPQKVQRSYAKPGHYDGLNRTNYELIADSKVTRILLEENTATGVIFQRTDLNITSSHAVKANKEVILAAGGVHSPQILQLSGIGPKKLLDSAGIETVVNLPGVGQNFQDHPMISVLIMLQNFTVHPQPFDLYAPNSTFGAWAQEAWSQNRTG